MYPSLLDTLGGYHIENTADWEALRRPELMALLENTIYGVRPAEAERNLHPTFKILCDETNFRGTPTHLYLRCARLPAGTGKRGSPGAGICVRHARVSGEAV